VYFTTLFGYFWYIENHSQQKKMPVRIQEIIFIWYIGIPFYSILEGNCPEEQTGQGNAGGVSIMI
jgi:hypothetical protein